ncbi:MAG: hypothetical protein RLZZ444_3137 [Pseudomonadota bacterium]
MLPNVVEAMSAISRHKTADAVLAEFRQFVRHYHVDTFSSGEVDLTNRKRAIFHAMEWPDRWRSFYFQSGLLEHDPVVEALGTMDTPFTWNELRQRRGLNIAGTEALNRIAAEGWTDGLIVPLHRTGTHYGLVSLVTLGHDIAPDEKTELSIVSILFQDRMRTLVSRDGFLVPPAGLTPRELDCIRLIAKGQSDTGAGRSLGIGGSTVHEHVERARRKLDAKNRAELVAVAIAFGIIAH